VPTQARESRAGTATRILDAAEKLVQVRGFNAFSYADVAATVGISKAALHYHYPGKAELGEVLITRYSARFGQALAALDATAGTAPAKLDGYVGLFAAVLRAEKMCLCGMLAAEYQTLPAPMQACVLSFFAANEAWLTRVLEQGSAEGSLGLTGPAANMALMILSGLEGAMLVARAYGDIDRFLTTAGRMLDGVYLSGSA
jgi:TetR/AcrR family transcriptional repressor of nem operon